MACQAQGGIDTRMVPGVRSADVRADHIGAWRPTLTCRDDQLLLQIRGAVAEHERTLIAERMRRGRLRKLRAGSLLPWSCRRWYGS